MQATDVNVSITERQAHALADLIGNCAAVGAYFSLEEGTSVAFLSRDEMKDLEARVRLALGEDER